MISENAEGTISSPVKLVIWDLDETFWRGTLSEGGIQPVPENVALVKKLAQRGIVSSICSKNDFEQARRKLEELDVWEYFVFPVIQWQPKGQAIRQLIERAQLRPSNVLFIDDNVGNREDALFYSSGLMCISSADELRRSMDSAVLSGRDDESLTRLAQYRTLEQRRSDQDRLELSNVEFLRQSQIQVRIDYEIDPDLERVVELLNRTNQLNFTKKRVEDDSQRAEFEEALAAYGTQAATVRVRDRYGDYGIVGFFLLRTDATGRRLEHFAFSCRVLNMGIEQYVFELLKRPTLEVFRPVANEVDCLSDIDWINEYSDQQSLGCLRQNKVLLIGGCELLQIGTYCSSEAIEFTNRAENGFVVRFDDPGFILSDPTEVERCGMLREIPCWNARDVRRFDQEVRRVDDVIISPYMMLTDTYFRCGHDLVIRLQPDTAKTILRSDKGLWFVRKFAFVNYSVDERLERVRRAILSILRRMKREGNVFVLGQSIFCLENREHEIRNREVFNTFVEGLCATNSQLHFVDTRSVVAPEHNCDGWHFNRQGYFAVAQEINRMRQRSGGTSASE